MEGRVRVLTASGINTLFKVWFIKIQPWLRKPHRDEQHETSPRVHEEHRAGLWGELLWVELTSLLSVGFNLCHITQLCLRWSKHKDTTMILESLGANTECLPLGRTLSLDHTSGVRWDPDGSLSEWTGLQEDKLSIHCLGLQAWTSSLFCFLFSLLFLSLLDWFYHIGWKSTSMFCPSYGVDTIRCVLPGSCEREGVHVRRWVWT